MAKKENQFDFSVMSDGLSEQEVFKRIWREPQADEIFKVPFEDPNGEAMLAEPPVAITETKPVNTRRMMHTQTILLAGSILVVAMLAYTLLRVPGPQSSFAQPDVNLVGNSTPEETVQPEPKPIDPNSPLAIPSTLVSTAIEPETPITLREAEILYGNLEFRQAYEAYYQLHQQSLDQLGDQDLVDFFILRMALCAKGLVQFDQENQLLIQASQSDSIIVQAMARYHQCLVAIRDKHYMKSITLAYQALALLDGLSDQATWREPLRLNCRFLLCRAMTMESLGLHDADSDIPDMLWAMEASPDPFMGLDALQLRHLLMQGRDAFKKARLSPQIAQISGEDQGVIWQVVSHDVSVEELLVRFSAHAQMDINWAFDVETSREMIDASVRKRPVSMFATNASAQDVVELAGGCAQLFADIDSKGTIHLVDPDPTTYATLSACVQRWDRQSLIVWQRLQWYTDEQYIPNAHYAKGLLQEAMRHPTQAIAEYRLLADRFSRSELAPYALLRSSRIKTEMRDFIGARDDLKLLVDQYPDVTFSGEAALYLADATRRAGRLQEAFRIYTKVTNLGLTNQIGLAATLGAATCRFDQGYYEDAVRWIDRHLDMAKVSQGQQDLQPAYLLLGRSLAALGNQELACDYLKKVLMQPMNKELYHAALDAYVQTRMEQDKQEKIVDALHALSGDHPWPLGTERENELAIVKARIYREMELMAQAISFLEGQLLVMPRRELRSQAFFEMGLCAMALEDYEKARRFFSEVIDLAEAGDLMNTSLFEMARASYYLGKTDRALDLCHQILGAQPNEELRQKTWALQAQLHQCKDRLDLAAQAVLNQLTTLDPNDPSTQVMSPETTALSQM